MCGIAGYQGNFDVGLLAKMSEAIAHRGSDDSGSLFRQEYGVGLAHPRLAIIDLSHAADQPMYDDAAGLYRELRADGHGPVGWVSTAFL